MLRMRQTPLFSVREETCAPRALHLAREKRYRQGSLGVVVSGSFEYRSENGAATAVPGTVILGNSGEHFSCHARNEIGNRREVVYFRADFLRDVADACGLPAPRFRVPAVPPGRFSAGLFGALRRLALKTGDGEEAAYEIAEAALQVNRSAFAPVAVSPRNQQRILSIVRHLETHFGEPWSLTSLAALARLSPYYFLRLFRRVTGQSPAQYVLNARLRAAANHLLTSQTPVGEIALNTGFNDISHFNASFRGAFGRTPTLWRALA
jgi:AraC family transcriptional regulator